MGFPFPSYSNSPLVTVLTAVHNGARYLGETIACIQAQTLGDWEYIIVDDASNDTTVAIVEQAMARDPRLRLLRRATCGGPYTAANDGLRAARGKYVVRIDADDLSPNNRIARQVDFLDHHPYRACVSYWQGFNEQGLIPGSVAPIPSSPRVLCWYLLLRSPSLHSAVCYQRQMMEDLGWYRELPLSQDYRLWCELTRRGWLGIMPEVLSHVRAHASRASLSHKALQRELALDILQEHLLALTGEEWPREDLSALWSVGHSAAMDVDVGMSMLERWDRFWKAAPGLTDTDRDELTRLSAYRRWKHLRANARRQPRAALFSLVKCGLTSPRSLLHGLQPV